LLRFNNIKILKNKLAFRLAFLKYLAVWLVLKDKHKWFNDLFKYDGFKGRVQCFSMQVVMNKYFVLNLVKKKILNLVKKFGADSFCCFREKRKNDAL